MVEDLENLRNALVIEPIGTDYFDKRIADMLGIPLIAYTRSLDASLPIENIIEVRRGQDAEGLPLFMAVHCRESDGVGVHYVTMARTEAIARRCAVLMDYIAEKKATP
jgi:hypothetical protein